MARGAHGIHSPFVYELYHKVVKESEDYYDFAPIEHLRERLLRSNEVIETIDFGTGRPPVGGTMAKAPLGGLG